MTVFNRRFLTIMSACAMMGAPAFAFAQVTTDAPAQPAASMSAAPASAAPATDIAGEQGAKNAPSCEKDMGKHCKAMGHKHKKCGNRHRHHVKKTAPSAAQ
ncbi:hypothetical protein N5W20_06570 [Candidatus Kirkpatrickella diaphorinae]|uniref:Uncharacterized protein n=1 Tax=Candidatus Kirkpatrickella diaphorinae TaxID=2984322 RepID=A0ABY6GGZ4_9PROT|nr:hypothetical protein [Candidatus Kirkpatrickella diaphorinae]UYH50777.1 hypothetical protein N5W20_06570 [Candidatus Kirkpatrickella diaphorinae]